MSKMKQAKGDFSVEKMKYLQILSDYLARENETLKQQLEDLKVTALTNKQMLKEYIDNITDKDKIVQKLQATIDTLSDRIKSQEETIKRL